MIQARHHKGYEWTFGNYLSWLIGRNFHHLDYNKIPVDTENPLVILANHISWWDGFIMYEINKRYIHKKIHVLMLEEQLRKNRFLSRLGAFSIKRNDRSMVESFNYMTELVHKPENLIIVYPQGYVHSPYDHDINFKPGIIKWLEKLPITLDIWMAAVLIDYSIKKKPSIEVYFKEYKDFVEYEHIEHAYKQHYQNSIDIQKKKVISDNKV